MYQLFQRSKILHIAHSVFIYVFHILLTINSDSFPKQH
jgi:hypothetical protein